MYRTEEEEWKFKIMEEYYRKDFVKEDVDKNQTEYREK